MAQDSRIYRWEWDRHKKRGRDVTEEPVWPRYKRPGSGPMMGFFSTPDPVIKGGKYVTKGARHEREQSGVMQYSNVNYIGVQSIDLRDLTYVMGISLFRYLMRKHYSVEYSSEDDRISTNTGTGDMDPYQIQFEYTTPNFDEALYATGSAAGASFDVGYFTYTQAVADKVSTFAEWFKNNIMSVVALNGATTGSTSRVYMPRFTRYRIVKSIDADTVTSQWYVMDSLCVDLYSIATICVQNNTPTDNGTVSIMQSDVNPIEGSLFQFNGLLPEMRVGYGVNPFTDPTSVLGKDGITFDKANGLIYPTVDPTGRFVTVPPPTEFRNCKRVGPVLLQPGHMKKYPIMFAYKGNFNKLLNLLRTNYVARPAAAGGTSTVQAATQYGGMKKMGSCFMFAFQKTCRTGGTDVIVNYHVRRFTAACFYGSKQRVPYQRSISLETISKNPV